MLVAIYPNLYFHRAFFTIFNKERYSTKTIEDIKIIYVLVCNFNLKHFYRDFLYFRSWWWQGQV